MERIAHCVMAYLAPTMGYVYDQLVTLGPDRSVAFAAHPFEPERFPFERVYILAPPEAPGASTRPGIAVRSPFHRLWRRVAREEEACLLHVHDGRTALMFLPLARDQGIPIVTSLLGRDVTAGLDGARYVSALQDLFREGDLFIVMSRSMARQVQRLGCPAQKVRVIHYGISLQRFPFSPRRAPAEGPTVILFTSRLIPKKGPEDMVRAFSVLCRRRPDVLLWMIGDGELRPRVEAIAAAAGISDRVKLLGCLDPGQAAGVMRRAHLFCLPSRTGPDGDSEGMPTVLKEAMASGLPIVSTLHAGIPELVEEGVTGYLVPEGDVHALAERLALLLEQPEQWESMGRAGRALVEEEFSLETTARRLEMEVYGPLMGRAPAAVADGR